MTREQLIPHDPTATVAAGGIAPQKAKLTSDERTTPVTARRYAHPAMPGKVVVRLEPDAIAAGTDAEMAAFGFAEPEVSAPLGQVRFRTLGFPAWALVHQPKKAKVALDVAEDMRKAKRLVAAKPGHARDAFEKIAKTLQRSAPQFLPSFWEECGRVIADQASPAMAAQCFEKARAAERAFKLDLIAEDSDAAFVEFALLGALSVKSLSAYAKELVKSAGGKEAYRRFRSIAVKRALGGMPPWAGMGKELRSLAIGAALDVEAESDALFAELLEAPGVAKAPTEFWTTYRASLIRLAKARAELRARLRAIWPDPRGGSDEGRLAFRASWLELLREAGVLAELPDEGLGAFVSRLIAYLGETPEVVTVIRELAPRLAKLAQPVAVLAESRWQETPILGLAELALELGVTLASVASDVTFDPDGLTCDPVRVSAHPVYGPVLVRTVASVIGDDKYEKLMRGKPGFAAARRAWLVSELGDLVNHGLYAASATIDLLEEKTSAEIFAQFPELYAQLARADLAQPLAGQLARGSADELTWPAYEQAFAKLGGGAELDGAFPVLTVRNASKVIALDGSGVVAEHDLVYKPKAEKPKNAMFLDGQFLILLDSKEAKDTGYWSGSPKTRFETYLHYRSWGGDMPYAWVPPGGGVTLGDKAFRAGDANPTGAKRFVVDGEQMFVDGKRYEPMTGKRGSEGRPAFLAAWPELEEGQSWFLPVAVPASPLGVRDGVWGLRVREETDDKHAAERYAGGGGVAGEGVVATKVGVDGLLDLPGLGQPLGLTAINANNVRFPGGDGYGVAMWTHTHYIAGLNNQDWASRGWGTVPLPPLPCWHYLVPRDVKGSLALRGVTADSVRPIFEAAKRDVATAPDGGGPIGRAMKHAEAAVRAALPAVTDAALVRGIAGFAERAAELEQKLRELVEARDPANAASGTLSARAAKLKKLAGALAAGKSVTVPDFGLDLRDWLRHGRGAAIASLSPTADEDARGVAVDVAAGLADTPLADDLAHVRIFDLETPDDYDDPTPYETVVVVREGESTYYVDAGENYVIEHARDGVFRAPPKPWLVGDEQFKDLRPMGAAWLRGFAALAEHPPAWTTAIPVRLAETSGLSVPEATLLSIGLEGVRSWGKDYFGKKVRDRLGLKMNEADAARTTFQKIEKPGVWAVLAAGAPDDPEALRTPLAPGGFVDRLGAAWKAKYGKRAKIPQELIAEAKADLDLGRELDELLPPFAGELDAWFLRPDQSKFALVGRGEAGLDPRKANELATLVAWLFLARPIGDAFRSGIPAVVAKLRAVVDDPRTIWRLRSMYFGSDEQDKARAQAVFESIGGKQVDLGKANLFQEVGGDLVSARDDGAIVGTLAPRRLELGFRPAKLEAAGNKIDQLARALDDDDDDDDDGEEDRGSPVAIITYLQSAAFAALAERVDTTPVPPEGYEANPLASAGKLVAKVAKACGLSNEAAALYLQTLALAEPKQRDVQLWNGWTTKRYAAAAAELVKKKLVIEGKRERAGRTIFLPGGYTKAKGKDLSMEEWKLPLYGQLDRHLPSEPVHALYARAWKRIEDGDKPR